MDRRFTSELPTAAGLRDALRHTPEVAEHLPRFRLDPDEAHAAALFLGPRAEHADLLKQLLDQAVDETARYRRGYLPDDPVAITDALQDTPEYKRAISRLRERFDDLLAKLTFHATPYFSMRYQGHMLWDTLLPGITAYVATMLHNPNNVTVQASTLTTFLELIVGWDLCTMVGFEFGEVEPWGHITTDGSVANLEAVWSARELRLFPVAVRGAVLTAKALVARAGNRGVCPLTSALAERASDLVVQTSRRGAQRLLEVPTWELLNLTMANTLRLPDDIFVTLNDNGNEEITRPAVWGLMLSFAPNALGVLPFYQQFMQGIPQSPCIVAPMTRHYSWPKAAAVTGLGSGPGSVINVAVDIDARVDIDNLRLQLMQCVARRQPVALVVAVLGSTEEGACDPLGDVLQVRDDFRALGLEFNVHADAAWGGYLTSMIRKDFEHPGEGCDDPWITDQSTVHLSSHTRHALTSLPGIDSLTIDPHKMGYVQYPAGSICYRDGRLRNLVTFGAPVIGTPNSQVGVGEFGIEGSKPGAAPAAVYLSHAVLRPSKSGYGQLLNEVMRSAKAIYLRIATLPRSDDPFVCVPLARLPSDRDGIGGSDQWNDAIERLRSTPLEAVVADPHLLAAFNELGPDENIVDYTFNLRFADGTINRDLDLCRQLNEKVYKAFHVQEGRVLKNRQGVPYGVDYGQDIHKYPLIITQTEMSVGDYGMPFIHDYATRLGLDLTGVDPSDQALLVNRTVCMDPWLTHAEDHSGLFLDTILEILRSEVTRLARSLHAG
jgi:glutamate/tyrosine decarboxylase-like PLP-dependent enzyme